MANDTKPGCNHSSLSRNRGTQYGSPFTMKVKILDHLKNVLHNEINKVILCNYVSYVNDVLLRYLSDI